MIARAGSADSVPPEASPRRSYHDHVSQLSRSSVRKFHLAFRDVDWDAPEFAIDPCDVRFSLRPDSPLGASAWYRGLPVERQARLGLDMTAQTLKFGIAFEAGLCRGLLDFAYTKSNRSPEYRYAMHELIEECQHSLMFQEFIDRSGTDPAGVPALMAFFDRRIARCGETFPEFFFFSVLAGEVFIDHDNRENLKLGDALHPLLRRIIQIHVIEEARHVRFAELFLRERVPALSPLRKAFIRLTLPRILRDAQRMMLSPTGKLAKRHGIPREVVRECYGPGSTHRTRVEQIARPVFELLGEPLATVWPR
jgi:hypothetical protein